MGTIPATACELPASRDVRATAPRVRPVLSAVISGPRPPPLDTSIEARKKCRIFMWVFFAIQLIFLAWVIGGGTSTGGSIPSSTVDLLPRPPGRLPDLPGLLNDYSGGAKVGTAIGVASIILFWFVTNVILGVCYGAYRGPQSRFPELQGIRRVASVRYLAGNEWRELLQMLTTTA